MIGGPDLALITKRAAFLGIDPNVAAAVAVEESGAGSNRYGDPTSDALGVTGPGGALFASIGDFQTEVIHGAGRTYLDARVAQGVSRDQALTELLDPTLQTDLFAKRYADAAATARPGATPGEIAALAQRPKDPTTYAHSVDALVSQLGGDPPKSPPYNNPFDPFSGSKPPANPFDPFSNPKAPPGNTVTPGRGLFADIADAITNFQHGAAQALVAIAVLGAAALLAYGGIRKTLG